MTSPSLTSQSIPEPATKSAVSPSRERIGLPILLFAITILTTTAVGMRYMENFRSGRAPLATDADLLPYDWVLHHLGQFSSGLPFSLTLIAILLAHEFGHYFACRSYRVRSTLPYLLPAPSVSGSFGAIIRLKSRIPSRSALIVIAAMGPIAGFLVAILAVILGLHASTYVGGAGSAPGAGAAADVAGACVGTVGGAAVGTDPAAPDSVGRVDRDSDYRVESDSGRATGRGTHRVCDFSEAAPVYFSGVGGNLIFAWALLVGWMDLVGDYSDDAWHAASEGAVGGAIETVAVCAGAALRRDSAAGGYLPAVSGV